jgi:hypothetical protein
VRELRREGGPLPNEGGDDCAIGISHGQASYTQSMHAILDLSYPCTAPDPTATVNSRRGMGREGLQACRKIYYVIVPLPTLPTKLLLLNFFASTTTSHPPRFAYSTYIMAPTRVKAHRIGALLFCPACGTLLDLPKDEQDEIPCGQCGRLEPASCESE